MLSTVTKCSIFLLFFMCGVVKIYDLSLKISNFFYLFCIEWQTFVICHQNLKFAIIIELYLYILLDFVMELLPSHISIYIYMYIIIYSNFFCFFGHPVPFFHYSQNNIHRISEKTKRTNYI